MLFDIFCIWDLKAKPENSLTLEMDHTSLDLKMLTTLIIVITVKTVINITF